MSDHESAGPPADDELDESQRALVERLRTLKWPEPSPEARERGWRMLRNMALGPGTPLDPEGNGDRNGDGRSPAGEGADEPTDGEAPAPPPQVSPRRGV